MKQTYLSSYIWQLNFRSPLLGVTFVWCVLVFCLVFFVFCFVFVVVVVVIFPSLLSSTFMPKIFTWWADNLNGECTLCPVLVNCCLDLDCWTLPNNVRDKSYTPWFLLYTFIKVQFLRNLHQLIYYYNFFPQKIFFDRRSRENKLICFPYANVLRLLRFCKNLELGVCVGYK